MPSKKKKSGYCTDTGHLLKGVMAFLFCLVVYIELTLFV